MPIKLQAADRGLTPEQLRSLELALRLTLPEEYRSFLAQYNDVRPEPNVYRAGEVTTGIEYFFGVSSEENHDLVRQNRVTYAGRLPGKVLAIAYASGGNLICLNMSEGSVYFWDHEKEATGDQDPNYTNMTKLASTFDEFITNLQPFRAEDFRLGAATVRSVKLKPGFQEKFKKYMS